jgi:hypothetical protein
MPSARRWIALSACHGRALWPLTPGDQRGHDVAHAAGLQPVGGGLHDHGELGRAQRVLAGQQRGERRLGDRQLLAPEEDEPGVGARERELDHDGQRALHVARAQPVDGVASRRPGRLSCAGTVSKCPASTTRGRSGPGDHARVARVAHRHAAGLQDAEDVLGQPSLVARLRRDVDELERAGGEAVGVGGHGAGGYASAMRTSSSSGGSSSSPARPVAAKHRSRSSPRSRRGAAGA